MVRNGIVYTNLEKSEAFADSFERSYRLNVHSDDDNDQDVIDIQGSKIQRE